MSYGKTDLVPTYPQIFVLPGTQSSYEVDETAGTASIDVQRTGGSNGAVSVRCDTADGTATTADLEFIRDTVGRHRGDVPLRLAMKTASGAEVGLAASPRFSVDRSAELLEKLAPWLGGGAVE